MKKLNYNFKINEINPEQIKKNYKNKMINIINVNFNFTKTFDKITKKSSKLYRKMFYSCIKFNKK